MKKILALFFALALTVGAFALPGGTVGYNAAVTNTPVLIQATAGPVYFTGYNASNTNSGPVWILFYDAASAGSVTVGTTTPRFALCIPPTNGTGGAGVIDGLQVGQIAFQNGIVVAVVTGGSGTSAGVPGTGAPTNTCQVTIFLN